MPLRALFQQALLRRHARHHRLRRNPGELTHRSAAAAVDASKARRSLRNGFVTLVLAGTLVLGLLLAVPGLKSVATTVSNMKPQWIVGAVLLELLSCASYVVVFLQVFEGAPRRVGARVALSEEAFGAAVSLGGVGSLVVGAWLMVERFGVAIRHRSEIAELHGTGGQLEAVTLKTGERLPFGFLFLFLGASPCTEWLDDVVARDENGFVLTGAAAGADYILETSVPGVLAAGDVRSGSTKRCATAVGEGAMAVQLVHAHMAQRAKAPRIAAT